MVKKDDLENRGETGGAPRGSDEANAVLQRMRGRGGQADDPKPADELTELRERIRKARLVEPPSGDNQFAQGCFVRGRDAALAIIDGESAG